MSAAHNAESHSLNQRARSVQLVMAVTWAGPGGPGSRRRGYVGASATAWAQEAGRAVARSIVTPMWAATQEHSLAPHNTTNSPRPWPVDAAPDRRGFGTRAGGDDVGNGVWRALTDNAGTNPAGRRIPGAAPGTDRVREHPG
jgi:hypothetical protein